MVAANDTCYRGETDSGAGEILLAMQALESREKFTCVLHIKTCAIVAQKELAGFRIAAEFNVSLRFPSGKFDSVAEKIFQRHTQESRIALGLQVRLDFKSNVAITILRRQVARDIRSQFAEIDRFATQFSAGNSR
jgi:hypothetical protein